MLKRGLAELALLEAMSLNQRRKSVGGKSSLNIESTTASC